MPTNPVFKNLDKKYEWYAYTRIGLYYVTRSGKHINFCDVHLGGLGPQSMSGGFYTGPKNSPGQIETFERTEEEVFWGEWNDNGTSPEHLGLAGGGRAHAFSPKKNGNKLHLWLHGPILFNTVPFFSMVVELDGIEFPKRKPFKTIADEEQSAKSDHYKAESEYNRFQVIFPKSYRSRGYKKCSIWGSLFSFNIQRHQLWAPLPPGSGREFKEAWEKKCWAPLPKMAKKLAWKIEDSASGLTMSELHNRSG